MLKYLFSRRLELIQEERMATFNVEMEILKMQYEDRKQESMDNLVTSVCSLVQLLFETCRKRNLNTIS